MFHDFLTLALHERGFKLRPLHPQVYRLILEYISLRIVSSTNFASEDEGYQ
jgi:hypothetical protein